MMRVLIHAMPSNCLITRNRTPGHILPPTEPIEESTRRLAIQQWRVTRCEKGAGLKPGLYKARMPFGGWPHLNSEKRLWVAHPCAFAFCKGGVFLLSFFLISIFLFSKFRGFQAGCPRFVVGTWVFHFAERKWRISRITRSP